MVPLAALWLPILLSAVLVFIASSIMHTVLPYHRGDYRQLPDEDKIQAVLRAAGLTRGLYIFPFGTHKDMKTPAMQEKYKQGPVGMMTVFPLDCPLCRSSSRNGSAIVLSSPSSFPIYRDTRSPRGRSISSCFA
jgi:hypothetical protein